MKKKTTPTIKYYESVTQDFVESSNQDYKLPKDFKWIHTNPLYRFTSMIFYRFASLLVDITFPIVYGMKTQNKKVMKQVKGGYFIYGNHTQPVADVFAPTYVQRRKRVYVVAGRANLGIPVLGKLLPSLGAITIPEDMERLPKFMDAVSFRIKQGKAVAIYPEAHVWPYATIIRPFPDTSFRFPVKENVPVFALTTTYRKRRFRKKPGITVYVDGPFYPDESLRRKERQTTLRDQVMAAMKKRAEQNSYTFIDYQPKVN